MHSFGIDFHNVAWEIVVGTTDERQVRLPARKYDASERAAFNQIIVERTELIKGHSRAHSPMMVIDTKNGSMILIEQRADFKAGHTANVTVIFARTVRAATDYN